ncbi:MAG: FAD-dependent oxidoreductase [Polyangiales bacterium]
MVARDVHHAIVLGAGVVGLSAAWSLARRNLRVAVVEQHRLGHARGSSHGRTRITRTSYGDPLYAALMRVANAEDWPALERDSGETLVRRMPGVFFGPRGGLFDAYAKQVGDEVELVSRDEASRRFPLFRFDDHVLVDRTAGVVRADATIAGMARLLAMNGATFFEDTRVDRIELGDPIRVHTDHGSIAGERLVIAAGPWTTRVLPELSGSLRPLRQDVGYFRLARPIEQVFVHLGHSSDQMHYALPAHSDDTFVLKAARHRTVGPNDDPDEMRAVDEAAIAAIGTFLESILAEPAVRESAETCFYTCTPKEDYVLDLHPRHPRVAIGAGFSGHGFKLAPLSGRILADLVTDGRSIDVFERARAQFSASLGA